MVSKVESIGLAAISEERTSASKHNENNEEYESVYNPKPKGFCSGQKKKLHPLMLGPSRQNPNKLILHAASKSNFSEFTQRIMSAKLLRVKQVQNQLNETQIQLNELINENRILKNLQKRQEGALRRYEGNHAELPQLIRSHNEEIRALKANNKLIKAQLREANSKLKERENELEALRDNYNKLKKLSTEKNLLEREKLQKKVEELQGVIKEQEEKIQVLSRKILLESKNYRHHLNIEVIKHKETQKDLNSALSMISKLENQLMTKEKLVPNGKLKRENKNLMPFIMNKSTEIQQKLGISDDSFVSSNDSKKHLTAGDSLESEIELLNGSGSSEDTPSPTHNVFPNITQSKKYSFQMETTTEIIPSKSETLQINHELSGDQFNALKSRKTSLAKRNSLLSTDVETNVRLVTDKINKDMAEIDNLIQKVEETTSSSENDDRISSLIAEVTANANVKETSILKKQPSTEKALPQETKYTESQKPKEIEEKRSASKRKFEEKEDEKMKISQSPEFDLQQELTPAQQQKLENMKKTWNELKSKIQEGRKKAEEQIKELNKQEKIQSQQENSESYSSDSESEKSEEDTMPENVNKQTSNQELRFVNFTDDAYILQELEKTDKIFNRLKNEAQKSAQKKTVSSPSVDRKSKNNARPKKQAEIKSFRTESQREPKYLEEFQNEYQKQNLLKKLKAIDVGKDPNLSTEETDDSDGLEKKESYTKKNDLKRVQKFSSEKSNNNLMTELFGAKHSLKNNDNVKLQLGTVANAND